MTVDPRARRARDDRRLEPPTLGSLEIFDDAGSQLLEISQCEVTLAVAGQHRVPVDRPRELLEIRQRIEPPDRADRRSPDLEWELVPMLPVHLSPRGECRGLGVDEQTVEVEQQTADRHPASVRISGGDPMRARGIEPPRGSRPTG